MTVNSTLVVKLEDAIAAFEAAWLNGLRPRIEDHIPSEDSLRRQAIQGLIFADLELRLKAGEATRVEDYLDRYPDLREPATLIELVLREYRLRGRRQPDLPLEEYFARFPQLRDDLVARLRLEAKNTKVSRTAPGPLRLNCPHCRNPIEVVDEGHEDLVCPTCGSSFHLDAPRRQTWSPDHLPDLGRFRLLEPVGRGGFGTVYRARDMQLDRIVAVKVPRSGRLSSPDDHDRFEREARNAAQLKHPGIVPVYEVGRSEAFPFIVTEFVEGVTLADMLTSQRPGFRETADTLWQTAVALEHAHAQGMIHRDLKPANLMLQFDTGTDSDRTLVTDSSDRSIVAGSSKKSGLRREAPWRVRIMDFGLARRDEGDLTVTIEGQILGTPAYMSPEQARGENKHVDRTSDIYSLGVILYELLTGELPFRGNQRMLLHQVLHDDPRPPRQLNDRIPRDLETIALRAMSKEPSRRYPRAADMAGDLARWLSGEPILSRPVSRLERGWRWCRRNPGPSLAAGVIGAAVLAVIVVLSIANTRIAKSRSEAEQAAARNQTLADRNQTLAERNSTLAETAKRRAEENERIAAEERKQRDLAVQRQREAELLNVHFALERGTSLCEQGDVAAGLLWLARCLKICPTEETGLQRVIRTALGSWQRRIRHQTMLTRQPDTIERLQLAVFSRDGRRLFTSTWNGQAQLWDAPTMRPIGPLREGVSCAAFSSDSKQCAYGSSNAALLMSADDATDAGIAITHPTTVSSLAFFRDGRLITGCSDGQVRRWDPTTAKVDDDFKVAGSAPHVISPQGRWILTGMVNDVPRLWDAHSGEVVTDLSKQSSPLRYGYFSPDESLLLTVHLDGKGRLWEVPAGKSRPGILDHGGDIRTAAFSPNGATLATGGMDRMVRFWDTNTGKSVGNPLLHENEAYCLAYNPDGSRLLTASDSRGVLRLADMAMPAFRRSLLHSYILGAVAYSPDRRLIATGGGDPYITQRGSLQLWDATTLQPIGSPLDHTESVNAIAFSPASDLILVGTGHPRGGECHVHLWQTDNLMQRAPPISLARTIWAVAFSPDGQSFAAASQDQNARVWSTANQQLLRTLTSQGDAIQSVAYNVDGVLVTGGMDRNAWLHDLNRDDSARPLSHPHTVSGAAFSKDGRLLITGCADNRARLWDVATATLIPGKIFSHQGWIRGVAFSPDGTIALTSSEDKTARLWDIETGLPLGATMRHENWITSAAFSPDGRTVLTGSVDTTAGVWDVPQPLPGDPDDIELWVKVITGKELDPAGGVSTLGVEKWQEYHREAKSPLQAEKDSL